MRNLLAVLTLVLYSLPLASAAEKKEWTFLIFLNGNNNLDQFGALNINQIEKIGSTDKINVVVQWASYAAGDVKRLFVTKDNDFNTVTSPILENMGRVDMGDYKNLVEFVRWGSTNFPADHYFVSLWDHGSGWHPLANGMPRSNSIRPFDISWDDYTGNSITNKQMGVAFQEISTVLGQKVDILGNDACLMAMAEVGSEVSDSANILLGSEEVEPAYGWPYDQLMAEWEAAGSATPEQVAKILTREYVKAYQGGQYGTQEVALSSLDLRKIGTFEEAIKQLGVEIQALGPEARLTIQNTIRESQSFYYSDYGDIVDFIGLLRNQRIENLNEATLTAVETAALDMVISNDVTQQYSRANGLAMWLPTYPWTYQQYAASYETQNFHGRTQWGDALKKIFEE